MVAPRQSSPIGPSQAKATPVPSPAGSLDAYLAELLADQHRLVTPAARAAATHDVQPAALRGEHFRDLIPLTAPGPGERYAFEVDLDACSGCKACVTACHSLNGLDDHESFRDVGLVFGGTPSPASACASSAPAFQQTVTTACHHCADPGCLNGCPVLAYEQDPATGIVRHLDDQCIGCSYCVLKCPYDVPKYNERLGIVRKCDMCHGRLSAGEAPACAQACPTHAIRIVTIPSPSAVGRSPADAPASTLLASPAVPPPSITEPTTRYVSKKPLPAALRAADADALRVQPAHWPLVLLLIGTQLSLGLLIASSALPAPRSSLLALSAAALFAAALAASVAHLGQPLRAWRVFLGLRRSWLSREAVLLGAAFPLVALTAALPHLPALPIAAPLTSFISPWSAIIGYSAALVAAAGVFCSAMLYVDTHRHFWRASSTFTRMVGTLFVSALAFLSGPSAALALVLKLFIEHILLRASPVSARLHAAPLRRTHRLRLALGLGAIPLFFLHPLPAFLFFAAGELVERLLYFRAVDSPKMPGVPA
jgi:Fe-S-cluster-containing dehydrogenase component/DMSO reductase anchor subunit